VHRGIDVSNNNGVVNYNAAKAAGVQFVYAKASEGPRYVDTYYRANRAAARTHGMKFGAYHFGQPGQSDGTTQAKHFLYCAQVRPGDLLPTLDFEVDGGVRSARQLVRWVRDFNDEVKRQLGVEPILYTFPAFRPDVLPYLGYTRLWLASWGRVVRIPGKWKKWVIWQNSGGSPLGGRNVDWDQAPDLDAITYLGKVPHPKPRPVVVVPKVKPAWYWIALKRFLAARNKKS
jgi:lysozyme